MKARTLAIIIAAIILIPLVGWLLFRDSSTPLVETIKEGLPFGSGEDINIPAVYNPNENLGQNTDFDTGTAQEKIFRLSNTPVAGFIPLARGTTTAVRYVDRATGHIFEALLPKAGAQNTLEKKRITNETLPKIYEAHFRADGGAVLLRSLNESGGVENTTLTLTPPQATSSTGLYNISAMKLRGDIDSPVAGVGNTIFYALEDASSIVSSTFTGTELKTLSASAFNNWSLFRLGSNIGLYTKASADVPGYAYSLSGSTLNRLIGSLKGLMVVGNTDGNKLLYSYAQGNRTELFVKDLKTNTSLEISPATLAGKCTWSAENENVFFCGTPINGISSKEPDSWYLGRTHFSDSLWRFDSASELSQLLVEPKSEFDLDLDVSEPKLSPDEDYLIFINKRDLTLWAVRI